MDIRCKHCNNLLAKIDNEKNAGVEILIEWVCRRCKRFNNQPLKVPKVERHERLDKVVG